MGEQATLIPHGDSNAKSSVTIQFNIEKLRFWAFFALAFLFGSGELFSNKYVFYSEGFSAANPGPAPFLSSIFGTPWVDLKKTFIFSTFGFEHACSYIDFMPAKEIASILLPFFNIPMIAYLILAYYRLKVQVMDGECDESVLTWSKFTTPFCIAVIALDHLWFVNDPELHWYQGGWDPASGQGPKGLGFVAHYVPYLLFQTALGVIAAMQAKYCVGINKVPFNAPIWLVRGYVHFVWILTLAYQGIVCAILAGTPILDPINGAPWELSFFYFLTKLYGFIVFVGTMILSFIEMRNGDTNSIKFTSP